MLAGRLPFEATTPLEAAARRLTDEPIDLRRVAPAVSAATAGAIMRCLARDPARRWPDAASFARALAPVDTDPDELPKELKQIDRMGLIAVVLLYVGGVARLVSAGVPNPGVGIEIFREIVTVMLPLWALLVVALGLGAWRSGRTLGEIWYASLREPWFWATWYPRTLRHRANVWDRLPRVVRMVRGAMGAALALLLLTFGPLLGAMAVHGPGLSNLPTRFLLFRARDLIGWVSLPSFAVLVGAVVWSVVLTRRFQKLGLDEEEASQFVLHAPPSRMTFWKKPAIEALLAPPGPRASGRGASTSAIVESIERAWSGLDAESGRRRESAVRLVRHAADAIAQLERTAARLRQSADPDEADRLTRKLEALGMASPDEPADRAQMRDLVRRELEIVRGVEGQIAAALSRRDELVARLVAVRDEISRLERRRDASAQRLPASLAQLDQALAEISSDLPTTAINQ